LETFVNFFQGPNSITTLGGGSVNSQLQGVVDRGQLGSVPRQELAISIFVGHNPCFPFYVSSRWSGVGLSWLTACSSFVLLSWHFQLGFSSGLRRASGKTGQIKPIEGALSW